MNSIRMPRPGAEHPFKSDDPTLAPTLSAPDAARTVGTVLYGTLHLPWVTSAPVTIKDQWLRKGVPIPGATTLKYTITAKDLDKSIVLRTQGMNAGKAVETIYTQAVKPSKLKTVTATTKNP